MRKRISYYSASHLGLLKPSIQNMPASARLNVLAKHLGARPVAATRVGHLGDLEFASEAWCLALAQKGVELLKEAAAYGSLKLDQIEWGFSEEYWNTPTRLMEGRRAAVSWFMVKGGQVSGGAGGTIPAECLALPGFHIVAVWGEIAHPSGVIYNADGFAQRMKDQSALNQALFIAGRPPPQRFIDLENSKPKRRNMTDSFPAVIGKALLDRRGRPGLHTFGANIMKASPELIDLPMTDLGVPKLSRMDAEERQRFYRLVGRDGSQGPPAVYDANGEPLPVSTSSSTSAASYPSWLWGGAAHWLWAAAEGKSAAVPTAWVPPPRQYEFAEEDWCVACAAAGVALLEEAIAKGKLDLDKPENRDWAFSEVRTQVVSEVGK
jgi:hypothetical protein